VLEFAREEEVTGESQYEKEKTKFRRLVLGSCKLLDAKLEKNGTFEFTPGVSFSLWLTISNYIRKMRLTLSAIILRALWQQDRR
jgi:hypothetical protein